MEKAPSRRLTSRWPGLGYGVRPDDTATLVRKIAQVNGGAWLLLGTVAAFNLLFLLIGNQALIRSGLVQWPIALLAPVVWWLNHRRHVVRARWTLILLSMADCLLAILGGQGTASNVHLYFLLFAVMTPTLFAAEQRGSIASLVLANLGCFSLLQWQGWPPHPAFALLSPSIQAWMTQSMVLSCVLIVIMMNLLTEIAAGENENRLLALADTDALTGLPNRRRFRLALKAEQERIRREDSSFVLGVFDLDHFKRINDELGHDAGDLALQHVCRVVQAQLRPYDLLARTGGEEFVLLLSQTHLEEAQQAVERIRLALMAHPFDYEGLSRVVTASIGLACVEAGQDAGLRLRQADAAMYQAKREGRNRICVAA